MTTKDILECAADSMAGMPLWHRRLNGDPKKFKEGRDTLNRVLKAHLKESLYAAKKLDHYSVDIIQEILDSLS